MMYMGDTLPPGTGLEEFTLDRVLGAGGFGVTYLARDESLGVWRALKEYLPRDWGGRRHDGTVGPRTESDVESYAWGLERFLEEARTLARFRHPQIVQVHRVFPALNTAYMVTEYVEGRTLRKEVEESGLLSEARARLLLAGLTDGLSKVHDEGLLHRDIKPENVMIRRDGTPVLIDFGSARQAIGRQSRSVTAVLTPGFAPLEQYSARGKQGPWTDIYSLGAVSYWALSGRVPPEAVDRLEADNMRPLSEVSAGQVSVAMGLAVDSALSVYRTDRPQSLADWWKLMDVPAVGLASSPRPTDSGSGASTAGDSGGRKVVGEDRDLPPPDGRWRLVASTAGIAAVLLLFVLYLMGTWNAADVGRVAADRMPDLEVPAQAPSGDPLGDREPEPAPTTVDADRAPETEPSPRPVPEISPEAVEIGMGLDRTARRALQRGLAAVGFEPGVPDGMFGPGTREQIRAWQAAQGLAPTGYLDPGQVAVLREAAENTGRVVALPATDTPATAPPPLDPPTRYPGGEEELRLPQRTVGERFRDCSTCPELVVQPGRELALGRFEVTRAEYSAFVQATERIDANVGCSWRDPGFVQSDRHPVVCVSWDDAQAYAAWLSRATGASYRLPSEIEWDRAARETRGDCRGCGSDTGSGTATVGSHGDNPAGLYDMVGNAWEWISDREGGSGVVRGGSWHTVDDYLRPDARVRLRASHRNDNSGFRVARSLDQTP